MTFKKPMPSRLLATLILAATASMGVQAADFFVSSRLGEPLKAVTVINAEKGTVIRLADAEAYIKRGLPLPNLEGLQFSFKEQEGARPILRISTEKAYENPAQTILLEEFVNGVKSVKEFALLVDPPLPQEVAAAMSVDAGINTTMAKADVEQKAKPVVKKKKAKKQTAEQFNATAKSFNSRLSALEKGQKELFQRMDETDKKISNLIDQYNASTKKETPESKSVSPAPVVTPAVVPAVAGIRADAVKTDKADVMPPAVKANKEVMAKTEVKAEAKPVMEAKAKAEVASDVKPEVVAAVTPKQEKSEEVISSNVTPKAEGASPVASAQATPASAASSSEVVAEKKPVKKAAPVVEVAPEEEAGILDDALATLNENPSYLIGLLLGLVGLVGIPLVLQRRKAKKTTVASDFTMQP